MSKGGMKAGEEVCLVFAPPRSILKQVKKKKKKKAMPCDELIDRSKSFSFSVFYRLISIHYRNGVSIYLSLSSFNAQTENKYTLPPIPLP